jgi:hypothetical protein
MGAGFTCASGTPHRDRGSRGRTSTSRTSRAAGAGRDTDNGLVGGSSPAGPTTHSRDCGDFPAPGEINPKLGAPGARLRSLERPMTAKEAFLAEPSLASEIPFPGNGDRRRWRRVRIGYYGTTKPGGSMLGGIMTGLSHNRSLSTSSPLLLVLQPGQIVGARLMPSGHCGFFRRVNWTGKLHVLDDALAVELPNIFAAAPTYTNR